MLTLVKTTVMLTTPERCTRATLHTTRLINLEPFRRAKEVSMRYELRHSCPMLCLTDYHVSCVVVLAWRAESASCGFANLSVWTPALFLPSGLRLVGFTTACNAVKFKVSVSASEPGGESWFNERLNRKKVATTRSGRRPRQLPVPKQSKPTTTGKASEVRQVFLDCIMFVAKQRASPYCQESLDLFHVPNQPVPAVISRSLPLYCSSM